nr:MAG TPA: hypothetical protein [Caudoviricetes sp.]
MYESIYEFSAKVSIFSGNVHFQQENYVIMALFTESTNLQHTFRYTQSLFAALFSI